MSTASSSKKEAEFRFWHLLLEVLAGHSPLEDLLGHREFQREGKRRCAKIMCRYQGIVRMYYGASFDEEDLFCEACMKMVSFWRRREAEDNAPSNKDFPNEHEFWGWFFVLAKNIVRSRLRKLKRLRDEGLTLIHVPVYDLPIADDRVQLEWQNFLRQFLEFTETLPRKRRRATQLWYEGYSTRDIKNLLDGEGIKCSNVTAQKWVKASLRAFAESVTRDWDSGGDL